MERDSHYAAVGIATVALLAALAVFTIWLARLQFNSDYDLYDIVFYGPVNGLSEGGEVHFNGIRVGEVTDLNIDTKRGDQVIARVRVDASTPVRVTSRAQLEPQGITGLNYIQITAGSPNSALLKDQYPDNVVPVLQSQPSPIAELLLWPSTEMAACGVLKDLLFAASVAVAGGVAAALAKVCACDSLLLLLLLILIILII